MGLLPLALPCAWHFPVTESRFEIAMSANERENFVKSMHENSEVVYSMLSTIDVHKSEAWHQEDKVYTLLLLTYISIFTILDKKFLVFFTRRDISDLLLAIFIHLLGPWAFVLLSASRDLNET